MLLKFIVLKFKSKSHLTEEWKDTNVKLGDSGLIYIFQERCEQLTSRVSLLLFPKSFFYLFLFTFFINNHTYELMKTSATPNCHGLQLPLGRMQRYAFNEIYQLWLNHFFDNIVSPSDSIGAALQDEMYKKKAERIWHNLLRAWAQCWVTRLKEVLVPFVTSQQEQLLSCVF